MKKFIKLVLNRFGIIAFMRSSHVYIPGEDSYQVAANLIGIIDPIVVDGGAHLGDMVDKFSSILPFSKFYCFEPDPDLAKLLLIKFKGNKNIHIVESALGDNAGKKIFNINASRPTNSLLYSSKYIDADLKKLCQVVKQVEVDVTTVDSYCSTNSIEKIDLLKLDLQGFDFLALKGARESLAKTRVVIVEVMFKEIYQNCHLFPEILAFMLEAGFYLYTLCGLKYGESSELLWADAIFVRREFD